MPYNFSISSLIETIGTLVLAIMQPVLKEVSQNENIAPTIAAAMLGFAVLILLLFWLFRVIPALWKLGKPIKFLRKDLNLDRQQFSDRFDEFDAIMRKQCFLVHGWNEFVETFPSRNNADHTVLEITVRPSVFINLLDAEHTGLHIRWIGSLSGLFISLGLLFTFIGLVAALTSASQSINAAIHAGSTIAGDAQSSQIQSALADLLKTASFKFWTSIAGLGAGILIGIYERRWLSKINGKFDELNQAIERVTKTITPEMIAQKTLAEIQEQTTHLRDFTGQFRFNMTDALADALTRIMPGGVQSIVSAAVGEALSEKMPSVMSDAITPMIHALGGMTGEVGKAVTQGAGDEIRAVATTLAKLPEQIGQAAADLSRATQSMTQGMHDILTAAKQDADRTKETLNGQLEAVGKGLTSAAETIEKSLGQVDKILQDATGQVGAMLQQKGEDAAGQVVKGSAQVLADLGKTVGSLWNQIDALSRTLSTVEKGIGSHVSTLQGVTVAAKQSEVAMVNSATSLRTATQPLTQMGEQLSRSITDISKNVNTAANSLTESQRLAGQLATELQQTTTKLQAVWSKHVNRFDHAETAIEKVFTQVISGTDGYAKKLTEYVDRIDNHVANISSLLSGNVRELQDIVSELVKVSRR